MVREWLHICTLFFCSIKLHLPPAFLLPLCCSTLFHSRCSIVPEALWQYFSFVVLLSLSSCHYSQNICCQHEHSLFFISFPTFFFFFFGLGSNVATTSVAELSKSFWNLYCLCGKNIMGKKTPSAAHLGPPQLFFSFFLSFLIFFQH